MRVSQVNNSPMKGMYFTRAHIMRFRPTSGLEYFTHEDRGRYLSYEAALAAAVAISNSAAPNVHSVSVRHESDEDYEMAEVRYGEVVE